MPQHPRLLRHAIPWADLWPSIRAGLGITALFLLALMLAQAWALPTQALLQTHPLLGRAAFVATSAAAVLLPALTNLPLVPFAVLAWGPWETAAELLGGWLIGAGLSFVLGRHASAWVLQRLPSARRYADIDRLIHPRHRILSLTMLRMTFPVDVLSYALGLFSRSTSLAECLLSTALGAAPFALLFALLPALPLPAQLLLFLASVLAFAAYVAWILRHPVSDR